MKKWRCTVCGYIQEGDNPPEECPLCKAPAEKFELVEEEQSAETADTGVAEESPREPEEKAEAATPVEVEQPAVNQEAVEKEEAAEKEQPAATEKPAEAETAEQVAVTETPKKAEPEAAAPKKRQEKKKEAAGRLWKCTVCGYVHEGDSPPEQCPLCKAPKDKFVEIDGGGNEVRGMGGPARKAGLLARIMMRLHLHPIAAHFPNGILPLAVIFLALAVFGGKEMFEPVSFYNLVAVLITLPLVLLTGFNEWKNRYNSAKTFVFFMKIFCSVVVTLSLIILVAWRLIEPGVAGPDSPFRMIYFGVAAVMLGATGLAGHMGGKLVFGARDKMMK